MLNKNCQFIPQGKFKLPVVGLLITFGILGLGVIGEQVKINLKSTATAANLPSYTNQIHSNNENSLLSRLRDIRDQRSQLQLNTVEPQNVESNVESEALNRTLHNIPTNTKQGGGKSPVNFPEKDGIYLYGQSSTPNELGQGYIVFQKQQGKVIGALYMPSSEFSCFQGTIAQSGELAMTVTSSPGETGVTQVSTTSRIPTFTDEDTATYAYSIELQDYHQLNSVSANDRKILQACSQHFR
ncbi:hypothetical protein [Sphaerospermopsis torques-reginae]|uniref:Uncharacterized protein n=1 Tax=Sphaerospermopsis torques-reginae ITEP-024 TaxID=984208 RepID=A0ABX8WVU9_9CYAN|nr:hypothetical protein [Sphaerospermopsis torques-reginae]QYX30537.1 hypothetical protein K2F26_16775 [Sphaerospermopsis torques-reginae ITEP-024]